MLNVKALAVKNYGPFVKQTVFEFKPGISVVYGLNKTAGKNSKNSNWVGKSLFFNSLSELLYDEPIVGQKSDKVKSGSRSVILSDDKHKLQITKISGKRESIKIKYDDKEIEHLTKTKALDFIKSKWKLDKTEFETFIHLDSRIPHPLVMGTSTERKHFFDSFFHLSAIDEERRMYISELRRLQSSRLAFDELRIVYKSQKSLLLSNEECNKLKNKLTKLKNKRNKLASVIEEAKEYQRLKVIYDSIGDTDISNLDDRLESVALEIKKDRLSLDSIAKYERYKQDKTSYDNAVAVLSNLARNTDIEKLKRGYDYYNQYKAELASKTDELNRLQKPDSIDKPETDREDLQTLLATKSSLNHQFEHAKKFKSGICPTCGSKIKTVDLNKLKSELADITDRISIARQWKLYDEYLKDKKKYDDANLSISEKISQLKQKVNKFKKYANAYREMQNVPKAPASVDKPKEKRSIIEDRMDKLQSELHKLKTAKPHVSDLQAFKNWNGVTTFDYKESTQIAESIASIEAKLSSNATLSTQLAKTKSRLSELKNELKDESLLKTMIEIFSDKIIKKAMVSQISAKLCTLLNEYASLVFDQDYKFELIWDSQLQLICTRTVGKQQLTSDVRKLSGAESKLFTIILVLSLLSFIDPLKRPKTIILDEPTANFSNETTQAFIKLLSLLKKVVPCIIVITPRDDVYPESTCYTVVRTNEGSSIVEGLPEVCT